MATEREVRGKCSEVYEAVILQARFEEATKALAACTFDGFVKGLSIFVPLLSMSWTAMVFYLS